VSGTLFLGTAAGGLSTVCGMAYHLGLDMGAVPLVPVTGELMWRDLDLVGEAQVSLDMGRSHESAYGSFPVMDFANYCIWRESRATGAWGLRCDEYQHLLADEQAMGLPLGLQWVNVTRPIPDAANDAAESWTHYVAPQSYETALGVVERQDEDRRSVALAWAPILTLAYENIITNAADAADALVATLGIAPTTEQRNAAISYVRPDRRFYP